MCKKKYNSDAYIVSSITNKIDITRIVKYACIAAVLIVAIIFSSRSLNYALKSHKE
jgi:Na+/H+ antiporter NhaC